jgi:uncharacterized membrane protein YfcA
MTWLFVAGAFLFASYIKGATGMGFPLIATPMVALLVDLRTTYVLLLLPNILMDTFQIARGKASWALWRRLAPVFITTAGGVFLGTRILIAVPERAIYLALAAVILVFLAGARLHLDLTIPPRWEGRLGGITGLVGGTLNGVTNVYGPIATVYLLGLRLEKREFVKGVAAIFLTAKVSQLVALSRWGFYTPAVFRESLGLSAMALAAFWVGLKTQDRVRQDSFVRIIYVLLAAMAAYFVYRGILR